ncbi:hypothetical protein [Paenibacillus sp. 32352]|uniref:hypothetical protein n=1 Tax=Paenibacillus sp. 32352 TaxID=1969111 RepID=UPI0011812E01|nr:hypothetical protein [Paenibacillus sp. 32352]
MIFGHPRNDSVSKMFTSDIRQIVAGYYYNKLYRLIQLWVSRHPDHGLFSLFPYSASLMRSGEAAAAGSPLTQFTV